VAVSGPEAALPELEQLLRTGPAYAQVEKVERSNQPAAFPIGRNFDIM
jgi:hypothetical protein